MQCGLGPTLIISLEVFLSRAKAVRGTTSIAGGFIVQVYKKIAAAIYEYQADCDGEWGEISFDFENGTAEIVRLADWDTIKTNWFANEAIRYILSLSPDALKKYMLVPLEPPLIS